MPQVAISSGQLARGGLHKPKAVVALDIGTSNSGAAFAFTIDENPEIFPVEFGDQGSVKVPTAITLRRQPPHQLVSFGAEFLEDLDQVNHIVFAGNFKMDLLTTAGCTKLKASVGGVEVDTDIVFARVIEALSTKALTAIERRAGTKLLKDDIRWVLTVPAIWEPASRDIMRSAAYRAGIVNSKLSDRLIIALEPECAALECQASLEFLNQGVKFMVLDCGGGTIDVTLYNVAAKDEVTNATSLQELDAACGGGWGSTRIDGKFSEFLRRLLGDLECLKDGSDCLLMFLLQEWEKKKAGNITHQRLSNPSAYVYLRLVEILDRAELGQVDLAQKVREFNARQPPGHPDIRMQGNTSIQVPVQIIKPMYDEVMRHISTLVKEKCGENPDLDYVLLLGGFSSSTVLQNTVEEALAACTNRPKLIKPNRASTAIVTGAARFGVNPAAISLRRSPFTYGIRTNREFDKSMHEESRKKWDDKLKEFRVGNIFRVYTSRNRALDIDEEITHTFYPMYASQTEVNFDIVATDRKHPKYTDEPGVRVLGSVSIPVQPGGSSEDKDIAVKMSFAATEIVVTLQHEGTLVRKEVAYRQYVANQHQ